MTGSPPGRQDRAALEGHSTPATVTFDGEKDLRQAAAWLEKAAETDPFTPKQLPRVEALLTQGRPEGRPPMKAQRSIRDAVVCTLLGLAAGVSIAAAQDALRGWVFHAGSSALQLVAVDESSVPTPFTRFTLRNVSGRAISAFSCSFDDDAGSSVNRYEDRFEEDAGLAPGDTVTVDIGAAEDARFRKHGLTLAAVIFNDGVAEGDQAEVDALLAGRLGRMIETERLRSILTSGEYAGRDGVARLAEKVGQVPNTPGEALASVRDVRFADVYGQDLARMSDERLMVRLTQSIRNARFDAKREIDKLRGLPEASTDPKTETQGSFLRRLREQTERRAERNRAVWQRGKGLRWQ